ncbi:MAG: ComF family protein [Betaproteobacteria bacterium]|nr:ComF family protein [Betaproteobacteria bacterium]
MLAQRSDRRGHDRDNPGECASKSCASKKLRLNKKRMKQARSRYAQERHRLNPGTAACHRPPIRLIAPLQGPHEAQTRPKPAPNHQDYPMYPAKKQTEQAFLIGLDRTGQALRNAGQSLVQAWFPQRCLLCLSLCKGDFCPACAPFLDDADQWRRFRCLQCGKLQASASAQVHACAHENPAWDRLWVGMDYQVPLDGLLMLGKFAHDANACRALGRWLGKRMLDQAASPHRKADLVIPMPSTRARLRQRGYNPVEQMARGWVQAAKALGQSPPRLARDLLLRDETGPYQSRRKARERRPSLAASANHPASATDPSATKDPASAKGPAPTNDCQAGFFLQARALQALAPQSSLLLLDDVMTTGATLTAACKVLRTAPIQSIGIVVLMRR